MQDTKLGLADFKNYYNKYKHYNQLEEIDENDENENPSPKNWIPVQEVTHQ